MKSLDDYYFPSNYSTTSKRDVFDFLINIVVDTSGHILRENNFKHYFPILYKELTNTYFAYKLKEYKFFQVLWCFLNDVTDLSKVYFGTKNYAFKQIHFLNFIPDSLNVCDKKEIFEYLKTTDDISGYLSKYINFKKYFKELSSSFDSTDWLPETKDWSFNQKLWHFLQNDYDLKLGRCPMCGKRCGFKNFKEGYCHFCSLKCSNHSEKTWEKSKNTLIEHFGSLENAYEQISAKQADTCYKLYGGVGWASPILREKFISSCESKYGSLVNMFKIIGKKTSHTQQKLYGGVGFSSPIIRSKYLDTMKEIYGDIQPMRCSQIIEKRIKKSLEKYGKPYTNQYVDEEHRINFENKIIDEFGSLENYYKRNRQIYVEKVDETLRKQREYETKKKNTTFKSTKLENDISNELTLLEIKHIRNYTNIRYSNSNGYKYRCDFYFPDYDLFVEIQGTWTHGVCHQLNTPARPYNPDSDIDKQQVELWTELSKTSKYVKNALYNWTVRDVEKRESAKRNNLNYFEIFSSDANECMNQIIEKLKELENI